MFGLSDIGINIHAYTGPKKKNIFSQVHPLFSTVSMASATPPIVEYESLARTLAVLTQGNSSTLDLLIARFNTNFEPRSGLSGTPPATRRVFYFTFSPASINHFYQHFLPPNGVYICPIKYAF